MQKAIEQTGVSLDWLILGKGEAQAADMPIEEQMLLKGWQLLDADKQDFIFNLLRRLARGEAIPALGGVSVGGNAAQVAGGDAHAGTISAKL